MQVYNIDIAEMASHADELELFYRTNRMVTIFQ